MKNNVLSLLFPITIILCALVACILAIRACDDIKKLGTKEGSYSYKASKTNSGVLAQERNVPVKSIEEMMPKFAIITNNGSSYQVTFLAHDSTNWCVVGKIFTTSADAEWAIGLTRIELEVKYKILKGIADDLSKMSEEIGK